MKLERELRRYSVACASTGVSMMRSPIGSVPASAPSSVRNIPPCGLVFGTVALSTTLIQGVALIDVKYWAPGTLGSVTLSCGCGGLGPAGCVPGGGGAVKP